MTHLKLLNLDARGLSQLKMMMNVKDYIIQSSKMHDFTVLILAEDSEGVFKQRLRVHLNCLLRHQEAEILR